MKRQGESLRAATLTFERNIEYLNNVVHIITTRPIFTGDLDQFNELAVMNSVAREITRSAEDVLMRSLGWSLQEVRARVQGYVVATNIHNANVRLFEVDSVNFNPSFIEDCIVQMQKSNESVSIFDLEWRFVFYESSLHVGGSRAPVVPKYWGNIGINTWKAWSFNGVEIGCAAYALNWLQNKQKNYKLDKPYHVKDALKLQQEMGWGLYITVSQLQGFVDKYPEYKLVVVVPFMPQSLARFIGTRYVDKTLILLYDPAQQHFACGMTALSILRKTRAARYHWCKHCDVAYTPTKGHECDNQQVEPKKTYKKPEACIKCGVHGTHVCELTTCRSCAHVYRLDEGWDHRCILTQDERRVDRQMFQGMPDATAKSPTLYVYDIEARMTLVETRLPYLKNVETTDDVYADEYVCVYEKVIQQHVANMIVYKQVFSDEPAVVLEGEDCLEMFLARMQFLNKGNNVCIAHNASGYDTRLIFAAALKLGSKAKIHPIMRGGMFYVF